MDGVRDSGRVGEGAGADDPATRAKNICAPRTVLIDG